MPLFGLASASLTRLNRGEALKEANLQKRGSRSELLREKRELRAMANMSLNFKGKLIFAKSARIPFFFADPGKEVASLQLF